MSLNSQAADAVVVCLVVVLASGMAVGAGVSNGTVDASDGGSGEATIVVDADGSGDYTTIQAGIDAATVGDTVEVRPGTYTERLRIEKAILLTAPEGARLDGAGLDGFGAGIKIEGGVNPIISGFNVTNYATGVNATGTFSDWRVRNTELVGNSFYGVDATNADGDWMLQNVTVRDSLLSLVEANDADGAWSVTNSTFQSGLTGLLAQGTGGAWTVGDSQFTLTQVAIVGNETSGDWTVRDSEIDVSSYGIATGNGNADWQLDNVTVERVGTGLTAISENGDWSVTDSTFHNVSGQNRLRFSSSDDTLGALGGVAIQANDTSGGWSVDGTELTDIENTSINATAAGVEGDATGNWWGQASGPSAGDCVGNVDCAGALDSPPTGAPSDPPELTLPGQRAPATDLDDDGRLEDVNGDGEGNVFDAITYYNNRDSTVVTNNPDQFDFDGQSPSGTVFDALALYNELSG